MNLYTQLKYGYGVERVACLACLAYICMPSQVSSWGKAHWRPGDGTFRVCVSARLPGAGGTLEVALNACAPAWGGSFNRFQGHQLPPP